MIEEGKGRGEDVWDTGTNCVSAGVAITIIGAAVGRGWERVNTGGDRGGGRRGREAGRVGGGERKGDRVGHADMAAERVLSWPVANRAVIHFAFSRAPFGPSLRVCPHKPLRPNLPSCSLSMVLLHRASSFVFLGSSTPTNAAHFYRTRTRSMHILHTSGVSYGHSLNRTWNTHESKTYLTY